MAEVENLGPGPLPFGLGYHPYFRLPGPTTRTSADELTSLANVQRRSGRRSDSLPTGGGRPCRRNSTSAPRGRSARRPRPRFTDGHGAGPTRTDCSRWPARRTAPSAGRLPCAGRPGVPRTGAVHPAAPAGGRDRAVHLFGRRREPRGPRDRCGWAVLDARASGQSAVEYRWEPKLCERRRYVAAHSGLPIAGTRTRLSAVAERFASDRG